MVSPFLFVYQALPIQVSHALVMLPPLEKEIFKSTTNVRFIGFGLESRYIPPL